MNEKIAEGAGLGLVGHSRKPSPKYWVAVVAVAATAAALYYFLKD